MAQARKMQPARDSDGQGALQRWLQTTSAEHTLRVGGCGHLLLSEAEQQQAQQQIAQSLLPDIEDGSRRWQLVTGMAPGADLLFLDTASQWLAQQSIAFELVAVLPVPPAYLLSDWLLRCEQEQIHPTAAARRRMQAAIDAWLARAQHVLPLFEADSSAVQFSSRSYRQHQYQRLAALLAQSCEVLIAIVRSQTGREPGGSAEVLRWRERPETIPQAMRLHASRCAAPRLTLQVQLGETSTQAPDAPSALLLSSVQRAEAAARSGNALASLDIVRAAQAQGLQDARLDYLRIQALANTDNARQALDLYRELDLGPEAHDEDWLALRGRLEKDLALRQQPASWRQFARAAEAYERALEHHGGYYSAINAASMRLLAGQKRQATRLARQALERLESQTAHDDSERYFQCVTRAEAALLLGESQRCAQQLALADQLLPQDTQRRSRTHRQLRLICRHLGLDPRLLDVLRLPPVVLLRQHGKPPANLRRHRWPVYLQQLIEERGLLHLCLQTTADLALGEHLLGGGARLYLSLPAPAPELVRNWRRTRASVLLARLQALMNGAETVIIQRGFLPREQAWQAAEAQALNLGLSVLTAGRLAMRWLALDLRWHGSALRCQRSDTVHEADRQAETAFALARVPRSKPPAQNRRMAGLIFADFSGFSKLRDALFPRYYREVIGGLARLLDRHGQAVRVRKTWGDALHVVTEDASSAAAIAIEVQHFMEKHRLRHEGMLGDLELRVAAHYAPVFGGYDEVEHMPAHFGTQLSFAARIEPVAPPGSVYVTENFAARLTFESPQRYALEYAGEVELAKHFGAYRLFALRAN